MRTYYQFTTNFANWLCIYFRFCEFAVYFANPLRISYPFRYEFTFLWIHHLIRELAIYFAKVPWIDCLFGHYTMNSLSVWPLHHEFTVFFATQLWIDFAFQELSIMIIYNEFTVCLAIALWISEYFMNSLSIPEFTIYLAIRSWMYLVFREVTINSLSFSRMYYKFTVFNVNLVRIHLMFSEFTMNSVGVSRIYY